MWIRRRHERRVVRVSYIDLSVQQTQSFEGVIPWLYLDTATPPNVTVGCGKLLSDPGAACALPFQSPGGGPASDAEISIDFHRVQALPGGKLPGYYQCADSVTLLKPDIASLTRQIVVGADAQLAKFFVAYQAFPDAVKLALIDMCLNLGYAGLTKGYPKLCAAVGVQDWTTAAAQCHRNGISDARNQWTEAQFRNSVV